MNMEKSTRWKNGRMSEVKSKGQPPIRTRLGEIAGLGRTRDGSGDDGDASIGELGRSRLLGAPNNSCASTCDVRLM